MLDPPPRAVKTVVKSLPPRLQNLAPLFLTGLSQKEIAQELGLSYHTVRSYAKDLYAELRVSSRRELAVKLQGSDVPKQN